jgi:large subunit ribosomal protein L35
MGYKFKPRKAVAKRFKVTKTGKLKRHHAFTSHLMSARPANKRRKLRRPAILFEGHARNMRDLMGISRLKPAQVEHERQLAEKKGEAGEPATTAQAATTVRRSTATAPLETRTTKTNAPARAGAAKLRPDSGA